MNSYLKLIETVFEQGVDKSDRTGTGTKSIFGCLWRHDLANGFPLLTVKKIHFKSVVHELLWFLRGESNVKSLQQEKVTIWDEWADEQGELGPVYGVQWRKWKGENGKIYDQIQWVIEEIKRNPDSRRLMVSAWNVAEIDKMALPPCHVLFQFNVANGKLDCQMYQRSADLFLGVPFNIASYSLLTHLIAQITNLQPGEIIISFGNLHLYNNHFEQAKLILERKPMDLPQIRLNPNVQNIDSFTYSDIELINYQSHSSISAPIAV